MHARTLAAAHDSFNKEEVLKHEAVMEELTAADKALERSFRASITAHISEELALPAPAPAMLKVLTALFKKRSAPRAGR